jgi:hypothetical protein
MLQFYWDEVDGKYIRKGESFDVIYLLGKNIELFPCLTQHHTVTTYGGADVYLHAFLTLALDGGIALGYGQDDRGSRVRFPAEAGNFAIHHHVQNGSGAHPASYPLGTRGSFPGGKAARA